MAWVRTAASLISFGFTIYKFFQFELGDRQLPDRMMGPRDYALMMIAIGLVALLLSTIQHRQSMTLLRKEYGDVVPFSTAGVVAGLFALLGVLALVAVLLHQ
jgi:putative membrane protein